MHIGPLEARFLGQIVGDMRAKDVQWFRDGPFNARHIVNGKFAFRLQEVVQLEMNFIRFHNNYER